MTAQKADPLLTALANVPDSRKSQGKRHPLSAVLAQAVAAVLSGAESLTAISQWGREQSTELLCRLGFTHWPGPCVATLTMTLAAGISCRQTTAKLTAPI